MTPHWPCTSIEKIRYCGCAFHVVPWKANGLRQKYAGWASGPVPCVSSVTAPATETSASRASALARHTLRFFTMSLLSPLRDAPMRTSRNQHSKGSGGDSPPGRDFPDERPGLASR